MTSTRADVIKEFGQPTQVTNPFYETYELGDATVIVEYSRGRCSESPLSKWDVAAYTVISSYSRFHRSIRLDDLRIDTSRLRKQPISDVPGAYTLESDSDGISIAVSRTGDVESIERTPDQSSNALVCHRK